MKFLELFYFSPFLRKLDDPKKMQRDALLRIIRKNRRCYFGTKHRFHTIRGVEEFRERVERSDYESIRNLIDISERASIPVLTKEPPLYYAKTSGTLGLPKLIPVTASFYRGYRKSLKLYAVAMYKKDPLIFGGKILAMVGPAIEEFLPSGRSAGSLTGQIYADMPRFVRSRYLLPPSVFGIKESPIMYRVILQAALACETITSLVTANPSTFLLLSQILSEEGDAFLDRLKTGEIFGETTGSARCDVEIRSLLRATPERIAYLESLPGGIGSATFRELWPDLRLINTWTGGNCRYAANRLGVEKGRGVSIADHGYVASEFRGTINLFLGQNGCVPQLDENFYEFRQILPDGALDSRFLGLHELKKGGEYRIYVTTVGGLYRYDIHDVVSVSGYVRNTPTIEFLRKGVGTVNLTGEKLTETQVLRAVERLPGDYPFIAVRGDVQNFRYLFFLEESDGSKQTEADLARRIDRLLSSLNGEYKKKRESGRLLPPEVRFLHPKTGFRYREHRVANGQRESQYKEVVLRELQGETFPFYNWIRQKDQNRFLANVGRGNENH